VFLETDDYHHVKYSALIAFAGEALSARIPVMWTVEPTRSRGNSILDQLEEGTFNAIKPHLRTTSLVRGTVLVDAGEALRYVWFPTSGVVSLTSTTAEGSSVEVAAVGKEGLVGGSFAMGVKTALCRGIVQVDGEALCLDSRTFEFIARAHADLQSLVATYLRMLLQQLIQSTVCNRFHTAEQRLSRWLLETADRAGAHAFPLTQEVLAQMLGMRRPWVTKVIHRLSERGCIRYRRGELEIVNRARLEETACDCYGTVRHQVALKQPAGKGTADAK